MDADNGMFCMKHGPCSRVDKIGANTSTKVPSGRAPSIGPRQSTRAARFVTSYVDDSRCRHAPHSTSPRPTRVVCVPADAISPISGVHGHPHKRDLPANRRPRGL
jgi:hypothetical protein